MDIAFGRDQDILSDTGFSNMIYQVLNLKPGAAMWAAPVCSSWVFVKLGIGSIPESQFVILHMAYGQSSQKPKSEMFKPGNDRERVVFLVPWQCQTNMENFQSKKTIL